MGATHAINRLPVFLFDTVASHTSEPGEEPFSERVHGVGRDEFRLFVDNSIADRGDKAEEIFNSHEIEKRKPFTEALYLYNRGEIDLTLLPGRHPASGASSFLDVSHLSDR